MKQEQIFAEYRDHMGSDLTIVNAARASFGKESDWSTYGQYPGQPESDRSLKCQDANLIRFLATGFRTAEWDSFIEQIKQTVIAGAIADRSPNEELATILRGYKRKAQHWAPFAHGQVQIRVSMPIFLARQFVKHQVGAVWSEESRRYISEEPGVWFPSKWHTRPEDIKQGSGGLVNDQEAAADCAVSSTANSLIEYDRLLDLGVAPEEARIVLPLNMMTTVVWTGSLLFWSRVYNQRVDGHAQLAAQELAKIIGSIVEPLFPVSWKELTA